MNPTSSSSSLPSPSPPPGAAKRLFSELEEKDTGKTPRHLSTDE
jgi:hypothetical protein